MSKLSQKSVSLFRPVYLWPWAFWILSAGMAVSMVILSFDYGIIWDEWIQSHYGKLVLKFLLTLGQDKSVLSFGKTMYFYGGLFDTLTAAIHGLIFDSMKNSSNLPLQADLMLPHWHEVRHVVDALFGFTAIFFAGLTAQRIGGWRPAVLTLLFLFLSPRFFGNSMNNPKDIPFAAAASIFTYFLIRLIQEIPFPRKRIIAGAALGITMAINIKSGGLLFIGYLWLFIGILWLRAIQTNPSAFPFSQLIKILIPTTLIGYFGGILFWPYGWMNPLLHPIQSLTAFSKFSGAAGELLFEGTLYKHGETPWYYLFKWIAISNPLFFVASFFLFLFTARFLFRKYPPLILIILLFCTAFPLVYAIVGKSVVYDSWRHFLFIYPPLIILAALTWDALISFADNLIKKIFIFTSLILLLVEPLAWMVQNHPNEYVYFNSLTGGLRGAYGRYETDYWGNCLRQASEGFTEQYKKTHAPAPVVIEIQGEPISSMPFLIRGLGPFYIPYKSGENNWKYSVEMSRGRNPKSLLEGTWPGPNAIYVVKAEQIPLCAVVEKK